MKGNTALTWAGGSDPPTQPMLLEIKNMEQPLRVTTVQGNSIIINELQICTVDDTSHKIYATIRMSNGEEIQVVQPPVDAWQNDIHMRKS